MPLIVNASQVHIRLAWKKGSKIGSFNTSNWQRRLPKQSHRWLGQQRFGQGKESSSAPTLLPLSPEKKSWLEMSKFASPSPNDAVNFNLNHFLAFSLHSFPSFCLVHLVFISLSVSTPVSTLPIALRTSAKTRKEYCDIISKPEQN